MTTPTSLSDSPPITTREPALEDHAHPSTAAIAGHPLHPAVVAIPIGFLTAASLADVARFLIGGRFFGRMARWLLAGGIGGGLLAGVLGAVDFTTIPEARQKIGVAHAAGNLGIIGLSAGSLALRLRAGHRVSVPAVILSAISALGLLGTGWLGGELAFRHRIGVTAAEDDA